MGAIISIMEQAFANLMNNVRGIVWGWHYTMVREMLLNGPAFTIAGVELGGYEGKNFADICASRGRHSALFWAEHQNMPECSKSIDDMVFSRAVFFWWPLWLLIVWYQVLPHLPAMIAWTFKSKARDQTAVQDASPPSKGKPGRKWSEEQKIKAALARVEVKDKCAAYDKIVPFLQALTRFYEADNKRTIGEFIAIMPVPVERARLLLPPLPTHPHAGVAGGAAVAAVEEN